MSLTCKGHCSINTWVSLTCKGHPSINTWVSLTCKDIVVYLGVPYMLRDTQVLILQCLLHVRDSAILGCTTMSLTCKGHPSINTTMSLTCKGHPL